MLPARHRLRASGDFTTALRGPGAARIGSHLVVLHGIRTDTRAGLPPRVGLVVSKAVGGAVVRNRTKRRLRAAMATRVSALPDGTDLVVRATPAAGTAAFAELCDALDSTLRRLLPRLGGAR